jgi:Ni/Co efflux regulator RcnB
MKKIMLTVGSLLFVCALTASAQQDTTRTKQQQTEEQKQQSQTQQSQQSQTQAQQGQSNNLRDLTKVQSTEIPEGLRSTLQSPEYKGWDASTSNVYKNKAGDIYTVEIVDANNVRMVYHFDKDGKLIKDY